MLEIPKPALKRKWLRCPYCGAKTILYDNTAECSGVFLKCTRGCKKEFEVKIKNGNQVH
jgi:hypothetical protein rflaF_05874